MLKKIKSWWWTMRLRSGSKDIRASAVLQLGKLGDRGAIEPLITTLLDEEAHIRRLAAESLARLGHSSWLECICGDNDDFIRLGKSGDTRLFPPLIRAFWRADAAGQLTVINALGVLGDARAVPHLVMRVAEADVTIRCSATEALTKLGHPEWQQWVKGDDDDFMRLGESGDPKVIDILISAALRNIAAAEDALVKLGETAHQPLIRAWENAPCEKERFAAVRVLSKLGDDRGVARLCNSLLDSSVEARHRQAAARVLAKIGGPHAILVLTEALKRDPDEGVRQTATEALAKLKPGQGAGD